MATVFMKWLENSPKNYDRGIQILTLGQLRHIKERIARDYIREGIRVLEIGCGTGTLTTLMAEQGATVTGIDASPAMLGEAQKKILAGGLERRVTLKFMGASLIGDRFPPTSFDLIVSTLVFSEFPPDELRYVLEACAKLLAPGGRILIADDVIPSRPLALLPFYLVRWPLVLLTWLLTRTSTTALRDFDSLLAKTGFSARTVASYLGGSLVLYEIRPAHEIQAESELPPGVIGRLRHQATPRTPLLDLWTLIFRIFPPHPKVRPGLYAVGHPRPDSAVLVTGNYDLTVRRLVRAIDGQVDAWVLVADSGGINVWCAAGGGHFTAEKVIAALKSSHLNEVVRHHALILPQLCANGVDGWRIRKETGWGVHWGPARAEDIPAYLAAGRKKTDVMRQARFPLKDRLEMATATMGINSLLILLPVLLFARHLFWPVTAALIGILYFYAAVHPWFPGNNGLRHSFVLAPVALVGLFTHSTFLNPLPPLQLFNWAIGLSALSVFTAAEMPGMSPLMRSEETNWGWEIAIGAVLGLTYWLLPLALGWS